MKNNNFTGPPWGSRPPNEVIPHHFYTPQACHLGPLKWAHGPNKPTWPGSTSFGGGVGVYDERYIIILSKIYPFITFWNDRWLGSWVEGSANPAAGMLFSLKQPPLFRISMWHPLVVCVLKGGDTLLTGARWIHISPSGRPPCVLLTASSPPTPEPPHRSRSLKFAPSPNWYYPLKLKLWCGIMFFAIFQNLGFWNHLRCIMRSFWGVCYRICIYWMLPQRERGGYYILSTIIFPLWGLSPRFWASA